MSYFTGDEYFYKRKYAGKIAKESEEKITEQTNISEDIIEELSQLSSIRHTLHCMGHRLDGTEQELEEQIRKVKKLCESYNIIDDTSDLLIPDWTIIPSLDDDTDILIELLDINESDYLDDNGDLDTDSFYDHVKNLIADIMDFWSDSIRHFFRKINEKYGTDYPDGGNSHYALKQELKKYFF